MSQKIRKIVMLSFLLPFTALSYAYQECNCNKTTGGYTLVMFWAVNGDDCRGASAGSAYVELFVNDMLISSAYTDIATAQQSCFGG